MRHSFDEPGSQPPVRVERALRLLPESEALLPLRALLISVSRPDERQVWSSSGPYLTLGKRGVQPEEVRAHIGKAIQRVTTHVEALYTAYLEALTCDQQRDGAGVVNALLRAGRIEDALGRYGQARTWYDTALTVAEALPTRRAEVNALRALGELSLKLSAAMEAARHYQRALALTEAGFDQIGAVAACEGLGDAALAQGQWHGGQAWYARGLRLAEASNQGLASGRLHHRLGRLAALRGDATATQEHLQRARECFEAVGAATEMAQLLNTQGSLDAEAQRSAAAEAAYREALAWARRGDEQDLGLEVSIRINLARLQLGLDRLLEAEEQMRRAEQLGIAGNLVRRLIQVYTLMGELRGRQLDPAGFVFFEQAIELCRSLDRSPLIESRVCQAYARFKEALGEQDEARAYHERAREILSTVGKADEIERVTEFIERVSA